MRVRWMVLVLAVLVVGCTEVTNILPTEPEVPVEPPVVEPVEVDLSGLWSGTATDQGAAFGAQLLTMTLSHSGVVVTGDYSLASGPTGELVGAYSQESGRFSGSISFTTAFGRCSGTFDGEASEREMDVKAVDWSGACFPVPTVVRMELGR